MQDTIYMKPAPVPDAIRLIASLSLTELGLAIDCYRIDLANARIDPTHFGNPAGLSEELAALQAAYGDRVRIIGNAAVLAGYGKERPS